MVKRIANLGQNFTRLKETYAIFRDYYGARVVLEINIKNGHRHVNYNGPIAIEDTLGKHRKGDR